MLNKLVTVLVMTTIVFGSVAEVNAFKPPGNPAPKTTTGAATR